MAVKSGAAAGRSVPRALATRGALPARRRREHDVLLAAARRVFVRRGYEGTRVEDVLRAARLSTRAFYRLHGSKDALFLELFARANRAAMARLRATVARRRDPAARLDAYVEASLDLVYEPRLRRETRLFASIPSQLTARYAREVHACQAELVAVLREIVAAGRACGTFHDADPDDDAWAVHGALGATITRVLLAETPPSRARVARTLRRFCRAGVGASMPPARERRRSTRD
jgi:AcrR family transcriptional regulator